MTEKMFSICLVDDSTPDAKLIDEYLSAITDWEISFHHVSKPGNLKETLRMTVPDLILLDYRLHTKSSGLDVLKKIRREGRTFPVIVMSGQGHEELVTEVYRQPLTEYISKSKISSDSLKKIINRVLTRQKQKEHREREFHELKEQARTDELTGLYNRRVFIERLREQLHRFRRYDQQFSVFFLDLDHFKEVNDEFGHLTGDYVLQKIGQILRKETRASDTVARVGGDEFCMILLNTPTEKISEIANRIRRSIEEVLKIGPNGEPLNLSCTMGGHEVNGWDQTPQEILEEADRAMYRTKDNQTSYLSMQIGEQSVDRQKSFEFLFLEDGNSDVDLLRYYLERILQRSFRLSHFTDPESADQFMKDNSIDFLFVDHRLIDELSGIRFLKDLRSRGDNVPALVMSGFRSKEGRQQLERIERTWYMQKSKLSRRSLFRILSPTIDDLCTEMEEEPRTVLLFDEESGNAFRMKSAVDTTSEVPVECLFTDNASQLLTWIQIWNPDVVMINQLFQNGGGDQERRMTFLRNIQEIGFEGELILISENNNESFRRKIKKQGVTGVVSETDLSSKNIFQTNRESRVEGV